jgi:hypothetical protein
MGLLVVAEEVLLLGSILGRWSEETTLKVAKPTSQWHEARGTNTLQTSQIASTLFGLHGAL